MKFLVAGWVFFWLVAWRLVAHGADYIITTTVEQEATLTWLSARSSGKTAQVMLQEALGGFLSQVREQRQGAQKDAAKGVVDKLGRDRLKTIVNNSTVLTQAEKDDLLKALNE